MYAHPTPSRQDVGAVRGNAALQYATRGWPVLPGAIWDGLRYTGCNPEQSVIGVDALYPAELASSSPAQVQQWWEEAPYAPLVVTGLAFDLISVPVPLAIAAVQTLAWRHDECPVLLSSSWARFVVEPNAQLSPELAALRGIEVLRPGVAAPMPPTRTRTGSVTWWVSPEATSWRVGSSHAVQTALCLAADLPVPELAGAAA